MLDLIGVEHHAVDVPQTNMFILLQPLGKTRLLGLSHHFGAGLAN